MNFNFRNIHGITLITLVITIIVLFILAGVSISTLTGDNGILNQTTKAKELANISKEREAIELTVISAKDTYDLGIPLYDRNPDNATIWNIIILNDNQKTFGSGWNYIPQNTDIQNYGKSQYEWLVNYDTGEVLLLETETYTQLDYTSTLAIVDNLALNIDATNMENESWAGIKKHGDVKYDSNTQALLFNEDEEEGGYLELNKSNLDFSNGFSFEIYMNLSRFQYNNGSIYAPSLGLFCKIPTLNSTYYSAMRFGFAGDGTVCRLGFDSSYSGKNQNMVTQTNGDIEMENCGYHTNENVYLTIVYLVYDDSIKNENYDNFMISNKVDKVLYYINGNLYGYTYHGHDSYKKGLDVWNSDTCPFFIGVCPWYSNGNLYYLKGAVFTIRLYSDSLTSDEVLKNYNKTMLYRNSINN